jgi:hypothetical protein
MHCIGNCDGNFYIKGTWQSKIQQWIYILTRFVAFMVTINTVFRMFSTGSHAQLKYITFINIQSNLKAVTFGKYTKWPRKRGDLWAKVEGFPNFKTHIVIFCFAISCFPSISIIACINISQINLKNVIKSKLWNWFCIIF